MRRRAERAVSFENLRDRILETWQAKQGDIIYQRASRRMKPELVNSRVGIIGLGQPIYKKPTLKFSKNKREKYMF